MVQYDDTDDYVYGLVSQYDGTNYQIFLTKLWYSNTNSSMYLEQMAITTNFGAAKGLSIYASALDTLNILF